MARILLIGSMVLLVQSLISGPVAAVDPAALKQLASTQRACMRCDLSEANLVKAQLSTMDLRDADLSGANLSAANLADADLTRANLADADLTDADLNYAQLTDADLTDADLRRAILTGADLSGAIWTNGVVCKEDSIGTCHWHCWLLLPDPQGRGTRRPQSGRNWSSLHGKA